MRYQDSYSRGHLFAEQIFNRHSSISHLLINRLLLIRNKTINFLRPEDNRAIAFRVILDFMSLMTTLKSIGRTVQIKFSRFSGGFVSNW
jgi:hypothetical protein